MSIDFAKLARIREQVAELQAGAEALFARYQERAQASQELRRLAVANAPDHYGWTLHDLMQLSRAEAEQARVDFDLVRQAKQEADLAEERRAEHTRRRAEQRGIVQLLDNLEKHAARTGSPTFQGERQFRF